MSHYHEAEYLVVNDAFDQALADLEAIVHAQELTVERQRQRHRELIDSIPEEMG